jgi:hypothetical protein
MPGANSQVDKANISRGTNAGSSLMMGAPKAAEGEGPMGSGDGSETDAPTGRDHEDEQSHNKEVEVTVNAEAAECGDADMLTDEDLERRAQLLADAGLMISAETVAPLPVISRTRVREISPSSIRVRTTRMSSSL